MEASGSTESQAASVWSDINCVIKLLICAAQCFADEGVASKQESVRKCPTTLVICFGRLIADPMMRFGGV